MIPRQMIPLEDVTFIRKQSGSYVNGDWVDGSTEELTLKCSVQPQSRPSTVMNLPEGDRNKSLIELYTDEFVSDGKSGDGMYAPDTFTWNGSEYSVIKSLPWTTTRLAHYMVVAAKVEHG